MNIKMRLLALNKKQIDLVAELRERGVAIADTQISTYINHPSPAPKCQQVLNEIEKILKSWEKKGKRNGKS